MKTGELIKKLRTDKKMTMEELGNLLNVSRATVHKWENGLTVNFKSETLKGLSEIFGISVSELLGEEVHSNTVAENPTQYSAGRIEIPYKPEHKSCRIFNKCFGINGDMLIEKIARLDSRDIIKINAYLDGLLAADKYSDL